MCFAIEHLCPVRGCNKPVGWHLSEACANVAGEPTLVTATEPIPDTIAQDEKILCVQGLPFFGGDVPYLDPEGQRKVIEEAPKTNYSQADDGGNYGAIHYDLTSSSVGPLVFHDRVVQPTTQPNTLLSGCCIPTVVGHRLAVRRCTGCIGDNLEEAFYHAVRGHPRPDCAGQDYARFKGQDHVGIPAPIQGMSQALDNTKPDLLRRRVQKWAHGTMVPSASGSVAAGAAFTSSSAPVAIWWDIFFDEPGPSPQARKADDISGDTTDEAESISGETTEEDDLSDIYLATPRVPTAKLAADMAPAKREDGHMPVNVGPASASQPYDGACYYPVSKNNVLENKAECQKTGTSEKAMAHETGGKKRKMEDADWTNDGAFEPQQQQQQQQPAFNAAEFAMFGPFDIDTLLHCGPFPEFRDIPDPPPESSAQQPQYQAPPSTTGYPPHYPAFDPVALEDPFHTPAIHPAGQQLPQPDNSYGVPTHAPQLRRLYTGHLRGPTAFADPNTAPHGLPTQAPEGCNLAPTMPLRAVDTTAGSQQAVPPSPSSSPSGSFMTAISMRGASLTPMPPRAAGNMTSFLGPGPAPGHEHPSPRLSQRFAHAHETQYHAANTGYGMEFEALTEQQRRGELAKETRHMMHQEHQEQQHHQHVQKNTVGYGNFPGQAENVPMIDLDDVDMTDFFPAPAIPTFPPASSSSHLRFQRCGTKLRVSGIRDQAGHAWAVDQDGERWRAESRRRFEEEDRIRRAPKREKTADEKARDAADDAAFWKPRFARVRRQCRLRENANMPPELRGRSPTPEDDDDDGEQQQQGAAGRAHAQMQNQSRQGGGLNSYNTLAPPQMRGSGQTTAAADAAATANAASARARRLMEREKAKADQVNRAKFLQSAKTKGVGGKMVQGWKQ